MVQAGLSLHCFRCNGSYHQKRHRLIYNFFVNLNLLKNTLDPRPQSNSLVSMLLTDSNFRYLGEKLLMMDGFFYTILTSMVLIDGWQKVFSVNS